MAPNKQVSFTRLFCFLLVIILALESGGGFNFDFIKESFAVENQKNSSSQVAEKEEYIEGEVLVRFKEALGGFSIAESQKLGKIQKDFAISEISPLIKGKNVLKGLKFSYSVKFNQDYPVEAVVDQFNELEWVEYAEPNYLYQVTATPNDTYFSSHQWYLKDSSSYGIETETAWDTQTGSNGVIVGVIDTGIDYNHPDLNGNMWPTGNGGWDFVNNDDNPMDDHGHGTHCAGIVAAETNNATGVAGIAGGWGATPGTQLMALKAFNSGGTGDASDIVNAINWAVTEDADILSMSFTSTSSSSNIQTALNNAYTAGLVSVAAAGNDNIAPIPFSAYPAKYSNVIAVTSTTSSGAKSGFANYGTWVDIAAPGSSIYSTEWPGSGYTYKSGTSMACPAVAGVAALLKAQYPAWDKDKIMGRLTSTAQDVDSLNSCYVNKIGNGLLNANSALGSMFWSDWSSNGRTSSNVSMVEFGGKLYQAVKGSSTGTVYTRSSANGTSWSAWVGNGKTSSDVTMTVFGAKLYQAIRGYSTGTIYTRSSMDGLSWSSWVGNGKTAGNVSMYVFNDGGGDDLFQAVRGAGADDIYTRSSANGTDWSAWTKNGKTAGDVSMYDFNPGGNRLYQAVRGLGADDVYTRYTSDGSSWSNWSKNGKTSSNITMTVFSSKLYQAVAGYTNGTVCIRSTSDGNSWSGWAADGPTRSGGEVEMVVFDDGGGDKLYQSVRNAINGRVHNRVSVDGTAWDTWIAYGKCIGNVEMIVFNGGAGDDLYQAVRGYSCNDVYTRYSVDDMP